MREDMALFMPTPTSNDRTALAEMQEATREQATAEAHIRHWQAQGMAAGAFVVEMWRAMSDAGLPLMQRERVELVAAALRGR